MHDKSNNLKNITIITTSDTKWYHNLIPHEGPYPDGTHVVTYIHVDTITYESLVYKTYLRAEIMAIYKTLQIISSKYVHEPTHIFTHCLFEWFV